MRKIIIPIIALFFISCEDDLTKTVDSATAIEALTEYATINKVFQDVGNNSGDGVLSAENTTTGKMSGAKNNGPIITIAPFDLTTFPKEITIDYGTGILCEDGITRKGIVTIVSTNWYGVEGSEHTTTFTNFYHNDYKVEGTHFTKNLGKNSEGFLEYSVIIENGKITTKEGKTITFKENTTRTWVAGFNTPLNIWDDEYKLDGTQSGISSKGVEYSLTIEESLHFVLLPRSIKSGILDIDVANLKDIKINYTTSTITILGVNFPFGV